MPVFLYSAWSKVFTDDGHGIGASFETDSSGQEKLVSWTPPLEAMVAVRWLRQLLVVYSKLRLPHDDNQVCAVFDRFARNEADLACIKGILWRTPYANNLRLPHSRFGQQRLTDVLANARRLMYRLLCNVDPREIIPRHGSGASACRTRPWERYDRVLFHPDQNRIWPWLEYAAAGKEHCSQLLSADFITDGYSRIARGVFVPKDYRGPRLISCEPATSMYYQQGLMNLLVSHLEHHPYTRGLVNFTDQRINQRLSREGSVTRKLATLDLKDASDRLSWDLVILLWPKHWLDALSAVRSRVTEIEVPSRGSVKVPLRKHAPMGSAVCFPVMALTIWVLIKAAQFSRKPHAWIYGDDIIVASNDAENICTLLESVGLTVNRDKSFSGATPFRESCGKEYWDGFDVTPVYCRYDPSDDDSRIGTLCAFANNIAQLRGYFNMHNTTLLVHKMTGVPIIGRTDTPVGDESAQGDLSALGNQADVFSPLVDYGVGEQPRPHLLYGASYLCQLHTMRRRTAPATPKLWGPRVEYRVRCPFPVDVKIRPESWGYVLRSSLIGGDLGFTESTALTKSVQYRYSWVELDNDGNPCQWDGKEVRS